MTRTLHLSKVSLKDVEDSDCSWKLRTQRVNLPGGPSTSLAIFRYTAKIPREDEEIHEEEEEEDRR